jgi:large subunit ribosomal protein L15
MTYLSNLKNTHKKVKRKKLLGRGPGSGRGKTSSRGHKGYGSRSGSTKRFGYEGGQMRLFTKLPRKGFNRGKFKNPYVELNLCKIDKLYEDGEIVNLETLYQKKYISKKPGLVLKILANGEINKKVKIEANSFSKKALKKLEDKKIEYKKMK